MICTAENTAYSRKTLTNANINGDYDSKFAFTSLKANVSTHSEFRWKTGTEEVHKTVVSINNTKTNQWNPENNINLVWKPLSSSVHMEWHGTVVSSICKDLCLQCAWTRRKWYVGSNTLTKSKDCIFPIFICVISALEKYCPINVLSPFIKD